jgi:hypothetical protein
VTPAPEFSTHLLLFTRRSLWHFFLLKSRSKSPSKIKPEAPPVLTPAVPPRRTAKQSTPWTSPSPSSPWPGPRRAYAAVQKPTEHQQHLRLSRTPATTAGTLALVRHLPSPFFSSVRSQIYDPDLATYRKGMDPSGTPRFILIQGFKLSIRPNNFWPIRTPHVAALC